MNGESGIHKNEISEQKVREEKNALNDIVKMPWVKRPRWQGWGSPECAFCGKCRTVYWVPQDLKKCTEEGCDVYACSKKKCADLMAEHIQDHEYEDDVGDKGWCFCWICDKKLCFYHMARHYDKCRSSNTAAITAAITCSRRR